MAPIRHAGMLTYWITTIGLMITGIGFLQGPESWSSSASFDVAKRMMPIDAWAIGFILVSLAKILASRSEPARRLASAVAGTYTMMWAMSFIASGMTGRLTAWSSVTSWSIIAVVQFGCAARWWDDRPKRET